MEDTALMVIVFFEIHVSKRCAVFIDGFCSSITFYFI